MKLVGPLNSGAAVGADGSATANNDSVVPFSGNVVGVYVKYNGDPPAGTTDVTIKTKGNSTPSYNILVITNGATDGLFLPRKLICSDAGVASDSVYDLIPVDDKINVTIAGANAADNVDVWLLMES